MFFWTPEKIALARQAGKHTAFYRTLADAAASYLSLSDHIADVGCGLGYLSQELSRYVNCVSALERDAAALDVLRQDCPTNVIPLCCDAMAHIPEVPYDGMIFCFFGHISEIVEIAAKQCRHSVLIFTKNYPEHRFSAGHHPVGEHNFSAFCQWLDQSGIPYESSTLEAEFDQPFHSWEEAQRFFALYNRDETPISDDVLQDLLISTTDPEFPLCLPQRRAVGFLRLDADEIRRKR